MARERETKKQYFCSHCNKSGIGYEIKEYDKTARDGKGEWTVSEEIIPEGWSSVKAGGLCSSFLLCEACANDPNAVAEAEAKSKASKSKNIIVAVAIVVVFAAIIAVACLR